MNWLNPLKIKENRVIKERAEQTMIQAKNNIAFHDERLNDHREKLGFTTEKELHQLQQQHEMDCPGLFEKHRNQRQHIHRERDVLQKAENAHKNAFVRQVASLYPERPEMRCMRLETAQRLIELNKLNRNQVVPLQTIEKTLDNRRADIQRLQGEITRIDRNRSRLQRAQEYLQHYEKHHAIVEKIEWNPFLKGKTRISTSAKQEYEHAISEREYYYDLMKKEGVSGKDELQAQIETLGRSEAHIPNIERQIQSQHHGLGLLESIINGIEQANREMQREQRRQQQSHKKKKRHQWELER